jgi:hypothetical protein
MRHRLAVVDHLVHRHRERVGIAQRDHPERIADQDRVDPGRVQRARDGVVVGGEHCDRLALLLLAPEIADGDFPAVFVGVGRHTFLFMPKRWLSSPGEFAGAYRNHRPYG